MYRNLISSGKITVFSLLFFAFYILGWLWPDQWWATHNLAFLPAYLSWVFVVVVAAMIIWGEFLPLQPVARLLSDMTVKPYLLFSVFLSILIGYLCFRFPIAIDATGDALRMEHFFKVDDQFKPGYLRGLLDWNLLYWNNGERTVLNGMHYLSDTLNRSPRDMFGWMGIVSAVLYCMTSLWFVRIYPLQPMARLISLVLLLLAPCCWMFFGHFEIYAPAILVSMWYCMVLLLFVEKPSKFKLCFLLFLLYWAIRIHTGHALLLVSFVVAVMWYFFQNTFFFKCKFNWIGVLIFIFSPVAVAGLWLYFFYFQDYKDPRTAAPLNEQIFLPLLSPAAPLDKYNLFSSAHLFDYFTHFFLLSAAGSCLILIVIAFKRQLIQWNNPAVLLQGISLLLYLIFFFVMNPLLGLPLDVDLFSITAPVLILFAVVLLRQLYDQLFLHRVASIVLALSLMTPPIIIANANTKSVTEKITSLGVRTFRTYWMGSGAPILIALNQYVGSEQQLDSFIDSVQSRIGEAVLPENDLEYAVVLRRFALDYQDYFKNHEKANKLFHLSYYHDAGNESAALTLLNLYFEQQRYTKAYEVAQHLIMIRYPSYNKALRIAIHTALLARQYQRAEEHVNLYLELWPEDTFVQGIFEQLQSGKDLERIKHAFSK